jgi:hypothetical protein
MAITYRSLTSFQQGKFDIPHLIQEQFEKWLQNDPVKAPRKFPAHEIEKNALTVFSPTADILFFEKQEKDKSLTVRARLVENKKENNEDRRWTSTYTLHLPGKKEQKGFFLFEIDSPLETQPNGFVRPINASSPRFMRRLLELENLQLFDGNFAVMQNGAQIIDEFEVDKIIDIACDPFRRGALILMGTDDSHPLNYYLEKSKKPFDKLVGLATSYILRPEATVEFNKAIGDFHAVYPGAIRTYFPEVDPATGFDDRRHPFIKKERVEQLEERAIAATLESSARRMSLESPMPNSVKRILERIDLAQNELLVSGKRKIVYEKTPKPIKPGLEVKIEGQIDVARTDDLIKEVSDYLEVEAKLRELLDLEKFDYGAVDTIAERFNRLETITPVLEQTLNENSELKKQLERLQSELNESQTDHLETFDEKEIFQSQIDYIKNNLFALAESDSDSARMKKSIRELIHGNLSWVGQDQSLRPQIPHTFTDILYSLGELPFIEYTGGYDQIEDLDRDEVGTYSGKTWEGLRMLNDYARAKSEGLDVKGIVDYLKDGPVGYFNSWPIHKISMQESESTINDQKLLSQRKFVVPASVEPQGLALMVAHLKIGYRLRVHFLEDVSKTGKIYVGYIGRHLATASSN